MGGAALVAGPGPDEAGPPVVRIRDLHKRYRRAVALAGVDLNVPRGRIFGLIGPDGAGKSSLMKTVAGVLACEAGSVQVFGVPVDSERAAERIKGRLGFMPQGLGLNLYPELSVEENVDFFARLRDVPRAALAARKRRLLAMTRLDRFRDRAMKHLSGGMKQKLALVCTLVHEPELLILDEPTTGVDPVSRRDFWNILAELLQEHGATALVSTAYLDEAERFDALALMYQGRVLAQGPPEDVRRRRPGHVIEVVCARREEQPEALRRLRGPLPQVEVVGERIRVWVAAGDADAARRRVEAALAGLAVASIEAQEPGLEDVFVALLREREERAPGRDPAAATVAAVTGADGCAIEAEGLTRDFGAFRAVDHVSFRVHQGEIFGLLGANGAGKTTVIKMLTGILPPSAGEGRVAGASMRRAGRAIRERIGYMSQAFSLYRDLSVLENLRLYASIYAVPRRRRRERIAGILGMTDLHGLEDRLAGRLPMGQRQRLALGCALLHRPRVLFLDEPTSGVDPVGRRHFWGILLALARRARVAILVTTHYMNEAEHCDRLALMYAGRIIADASPGRLKSELAAEGTLLELRCERPGEAVRRLQAAGFDEAALFGRAIHVLVADPEADAGRVRRVLAEAGIRVTALEPRAPGLEDVFVHRILEQERRVAQP